MKSVSSGTRSSPAHRKIRLINDHVHGPVQFTDLEWELLNTKAFQRLRRIKQLGLVDLVFPGAEHSRFTHSVGTLAMMNKLVTQLLANCASDPGFCEKLRHAFPTLRVAALLHDVGHFPLSHLAERIYQARSCVQHEHEDIASDTDPTPFPNYLQEAAWILSEKADERGRAWNHEAMSGYVVQERNEIRDILENHPDAKGAPEVFAPNRIAALIKGDLLDDEDYVIRNLMHSDLDADRLDYLERDCAETGMVYGKVDSSYIATMLQVALAEESQPPRRVLAFANKGLRAADHYTMARFHFYTQIIYHKTVSAFSVLAGALLLYMLDHGRLEPFNSYNAVRESVNSDVFLHFDDQLFWGQVRDIMRGGGQAAAWAHCLYHRKPPQVIQMDDRLQNVYLNDTRRRIERQRYLSDACRATGLLPDRVFVVETQLGLGQDASSFEKNAERVRVIDAIAGSGSLQSGATQEPVLPAPAARCLTQYEQSLSASVARSWRRIVAFRVHDAVPYPDQAESEVASSGSSR